MPFVLLLAATLAQAAPAPAVARVSLFIGPAPQKGAAVDRRLRERQDSAADVIHFLSESRVVALVPSPSAADVVVEIVSRGGESGAAYSRPAFAYVVNAALRVGAYELPIRGSSSGSSPTWRFAAFDLAGEIERWVKDNQARLAARAVVPSPAATAVADRARRLPERVAVYCGAALEDSGFVDRDLGARRDSANDLAKALGRDAGVTIVETADKADVVVEILERTRSSRVTGTTQMKSGTRYTTLSTSILSARIRGGGADAVLEGRSSGFSESWRGAAGDLAKKVTQWIASTRASGGR